MHEEQQAALQGRLNASHSAGSIEASRNGSGSSIRHDGSHHLPPPIDMSNMSNQYTGHMQPQHQPHQQQQQQQQQRSGGFYMRNKRDDSVPVKGSWAQALARPTGEASSSLPGPSGSGNGLVDLHMATEAFRDAFSATAPPMDGPLESDQDPLLAEAYKSPANPMTGLTAAMLHPVSPSYILYTGIPTVCANRHNRLSVGCM